MADAEAVMAGVPRADGVSYSGLVLNRRGLDRALEAGVDEVNVVVVATDTFSQRNQGMTTEEGVAAAVEIVTDVDWHDRQKLLKLAFPLDVHADRATSEIQFGHVHRPTHANTSWDAARFETCAHRWVHVGEPGYGVAVANDATYGHDIARNGRTTTVRLSLLRAPLFPDPDADQGTHRFAVTLRAGATIGDGAIVGVGAVVRKQFCDEGSSVAANEIVVPFRLTLWQPAQVSGLVGDDGTMNGDACDAPNGSR